MALDRIDRRILNKLQRDGRMTNADLALAINLSPSACFRRVRRLEADGVIERYVALVNQKAVGRPTNVFVEVSLTSQSVDALDAFEAAVLACPDILECHLMSGDADYMLRIVVRDAEDYERVHRQYLSTFPAVARIRSSFGLRTICKKTAIEA